MKRVRYAKTIILGIVILFVISTGLSFQQSYAYETTFETTGYVLKNNPTICAIEPSVEGLEQWQVDRFIEQSKISSDEWETKFKNNQKNSEVWEITYVQSSESDDNLDCDISITFLPKAEDSRFEHGLLGVAEYKPIEDKYLIKIYYLLGKLCYDSERIGKYYLVLV